MRSTSMDSVNDDKMHKQIAKRVCYIVCSMHMCYKVSVTDCGNITHYCISMEKCLLQRF